MKTKIVRILAMTVAAISLLSVSAYAAGITYNTSRISKTANRILKGNEGEGAATVFQGGVDKIVSTNELTDPEEVEITYTYNGKSDKETATVRTTTWSGLIPKATHTQHPYTVKTKPGNSMTYVYWRVTETKADLPYKTRVVKVVPNDPTPPRTAPTVKTVTYTGGAQQLVNTGSNPTNGKLEYRLNNGSWSTSIPTATNAGDYTIAYRVAGVGKYNTLAPVAITTKAKINKANSTYTTEPAANVLTWTGAAQELVTAGTASGGTVQYKLGDGEWSADIPTAKEVGTYTVYYKVAGDANHNDTAEKSVTATIGEKAAEATYKNVKDIGGDGYSGEASAWTVTVTPGSTAIESVDVKVNGKSSDGKWSSTQAISGGPVILGVVVKAAAEKVTSMTAVVNGSDIQATPDSTSID